MTLLMENIPQGEGGAGGVHGICQSLQSCLQQQASGTYVSCTYLYIWQEPRAEVERTEVKPCACRAQDSSTRQYHQVANARCFLSSST
jgi:hypothetical protein